MSQTLRAKSRPEVQKKVMLAAYSEVCKSYHAIDKFRMKLLGLLPLASLVGVFLLEKTNLGADQIQNGTARHDLVGFASIFAAMQTLALFGYEIRGIRRCHNLITEGKHIEELLGIGHGQFHVCEQEHQNPSMITKALNAKLVACLVYSLVFAGWLFIALRIGFGISTGTCAICATVVGTIVALTTFLSVRRLTAP